MKWFVRAIIFLIGLVPAAAFPVNQEALDAAKNSYESIKPSFESAKGVIDKTHDVLSRFNDSIVTWRGAVSRETQNRGIEGIDDLAKENIGAVVDSLFEKAKSSLGLPDNVEIPESMKEKVVEKLKDKFKEGIPPKIVNRLGYMYTLSAYDRRLRESGVYGKLQYLKDKFDTAAKYAGKFEKAVEFVSIFSPSAEDGPVGRMKNVRSLLKTMASIAKPIPLMGDIIEGYADVTEGFERALGQLDKLLKEARFGSLCGQQDVDRDIQDFFERTYPGEMCATYFSVTGSYTHLSPIRAWAGGEQGNYVFLWYEGDGRLMSESAFKTLYNSFAALKENGYYSQLADHSEFMRFAILKDSTIAEQLAKFRRYYAKMQDSSFRGALEWDEKLDKNYNLFALDGSKLGYSYGSGENEEQEFYGLCFFSKHFREGFQGLYEKYKDAFVMEGVVAPEAKNAKLEAVQILVNGEKPREQACAGSKCSFKQLTLTREFSVKASAAGFQDAEKKFSGTRYPFLLLPRVSVRIEGPRSGQVGEKLQLRAVVSGMGGDSTVKYRWSADGIESGDDSGTIEFIPEKMGRHSIQLEIFEDNGDSAGAATHSLFAFEKVDVRVNGPDKAAVGDAVKFTALAAASEEFMKTFSFLWTVEGKKEVIGRGSELSHKVGYPGLYTITVHVTAPIEGKEYTVAKASRRMEVSDVSVRIEGPESGRIGQQTFLRAIALSDETTKATFKYAWRQEGSSAVISDRETLAARLFSAGRYRYTVVVYKVAGNQSVKFGEATHQLEIEPPTIRIEGAAQINAGDAVRLQAQVAVDPSLNQDMRFVWTAGGKTVGSTNVYSSKIVHPGDYIFELSVTLASGKTQHRLGEARHRLSVVEVPLSVAVRGPDELAIGQEGGFTASVSGGPAGEKYSVEWYHNGRRMEGNGWSNRIKAAVPGLQTVGVMIYRWMESKPQKAAEGRHVFTVKPPDAAGSIAIGGGPDSIKPGETAVYSARISETVPGMNYYISWIVDGRAAGNDNSISLTGRTAPSSHAIRAELWMKADRQQPVRVATAYRTLNVISVPDPAQLRQEEERRRQAEDRQRQEQARLRELERQRETEKQRQQELQRQQAAKQQQSKPAPRTFAQLTEKDRQNVLTCLCKCNTTAVPGAVATYYDPKPNNASGSCAKVSNGPCINQGFGCWRHTPVATGTCARQCMESANVQSVPEDVLKPVKESADTKKAEPVKPEESQGNQKQYDECLKSSQKSYDDALAWSQKVGQKDYWTLFRCGDMGTNWQEYPGKDCCDAWSKSKDHDGMQRCGWNKKLDKLKKELDQKKAECDKYKPRRLNFRYTK